VLTLLALEFNFAEQTFGFIRDNAVTCFDSWRDFVYALALKVYASLIIANASERVYPPDSRNGEVVAAAQLVGYFHGIPVQAVVKLGHSKGLLLPPSIQELRVLDVERRPEIANLTNESFFQEIITECPNTLPEAIKLAENYIRSCGERSPNYGGVTHIAIQTKERFEWKIPPGIRPKTSR
jgi:hypothetical protein